MAIKEYEAFATKSETLTPDEFVSLPADQKAHIISSKIVPPSLNEKSFGKISVVYDTPLYALATRKIK
jgi:hypothetical protein